MTSEPPLRTALVQQLREVRGTNPMFYASFLMLGTLYLSLFGFLALWGLKSLWGAL